MYSGQSDSSSSSRMKAENGKKRPREMGESSISRKVNIKISGPDGASIAYRFPCDRPLQKLLMRYCDDKCWEYLNMNFINSEGRRVLVKRTPDELGMVDGEEIVACVRVGGGGGGGYWII